MATSIIPAVILPMTSTETRYVAMIARVIPFIVTTAKATGMNTYYYGYGPYWGREEEHRWGEEREHGRERGEHHEEREHHEGGERYHGGEHR